MIILPCADLSHPQPKDQPKPKYTGPASWDWRQQGVSTNVFLYTTHPHEPDIGVKQDGIDVYRFGLGCHIRQGSGTVRLVLVRFPLGSFCYLEHT